MTQNLTKKKLELHVKVPNVFTKKILLLQVDHSRYSPIAPYCVWNQNVTTFGSKMAERTNKQKPDDYITLDACMKTKLN